MIPVQKSFPPERLRHMRKVMKYDRRTVAEIARDNEWFARWKLSQQRQSWWFAVIGGMVIALIAFVVAGGCR